MTITDTTLTGNSSGFSGGGLRVGATATVRRSTFSANRAANFAGGIDVSSQFEFFPGGLTLENSTVSGNSATVNAGGIGNFNVAKLVSVTVASNSAPRKRTSPSWALPSRVRSPS